jgi:hypothetical protein
MLTGIGLAGKELNMVFKTYKVIDSLFSAPEGICESITQIIELMREDNRIITNMEFEHEDYKRNKIFSYTDGKSLYQIAYNRHIELIFLGDYHEDDMCFMVVKNGKRLINIDDNNWHHYFPYAEELLEKYAKEHKLKKVKK